MPLYDVLMLSVSPSAGAEVVVVVSSGVVAVKSPPPHAQQAWFALTPAYFPLSGASSLFSSFPHHCSNAYVSQLSSNLSFQFGKSVQVPGAEVYFGAAVTAFAEVEKSVGSTVDRLGPVEAVAGKIVVGACSRYRRMTISVSTPTNKRDSRNQCLHNTF